MKTINVVGFGDLLLESLLGVALENTSKDIGGLPDPEVVGMALGLVKTANTRSTNRKSTARLIRNISHALKAAGWEEAQQDSSNKEIS